MRWRKIFLGVFPPRNIFSIDRKLAVQDNDEKILNYSMLHRRILLILCLVLAFVFCVSAQGLASNPADYERAKAQLAKLHKGKASAQAWLSCAESFRKAYNNNPRWRLRVAALYR